VALIPPNLSIKITNCGEANYDRMKKAYMVYIITPNGNKKHAAGVGTPVRPVKAALPPVRSIEVTRMLVINPKTVKTKWVSMPYLALITSRNVLEKLDIRTAFQSVELRFRMYIPTQGEGRGLYRHGLTCAFGALLFNSMAMDANNKICTVAPEAYQKGPETPYR
jgi:hypothetical protein